MGLQWHGSFRFGLLIHLYLSLAAIEVPEDFAAVDTNVPINREPPASSLQTNLPPVFLRAPSSTKVALAVSPSTTPVTWMGVRLVVGRFLPSSETFSPPPVNSFRLSLITTCQPTYKSHSASQELCSIVF